MKQILLLFFLIPILSLGQVQIGNTINGNLQFEQLGRSISLSADGNILAVGADGANGTFSNSGIVRVYENINGIWTQIGNDIIGNQFDVLSLSVTLSSDGSVVAVGADELVTLRGFVRIFKNISGVWTQVGEDILGISDYDRFGGSISLNSSGSIVAVGAKWESGRRGEVRIFENISGVWTQIGQDINGDALYEELGISVSLSSDGTKVAIGARNNNDGAFSAGQVRIFENISGIWTQIGQDINGEASGDNLGFSVSLSSDGNIVAAAAPRTDYNGTNSGQITVYENINGIWTQIGQNIDGEAEGDFSGRVVISDDGSIVAIGTDYNNNSAGHVRIFKNISGVWTQIGQDIDGNNSDQLGFSLAISADGSIVATGAYTANTVNGTGTGYATVYDLSALLSTDKQTISNFILYPNPTKNQFTIQLNDYLKLENVNIYDNLGKLVLSLKETIIDTSKLSSGLYVVEVETESGKQTKKLIIE